MPIYSSANMLMCYKSPDQTEPGKEAGTRDGSKLSVLCYAL